MWNNKPKALSFTFDDGLVQDIRLISIFNKYGLKATFNINSELLGTRRVANNNEFVIVKPDEVKDIYRNHEIAAHTLTHPNLTTLDDAEIIRQVEEDRLNLEKLVGYEVVGFAYPCGGINSSKHVAQIIKEHTGVKYARSNIMFNGFDIPTDMYNLSASVHTWSYNIMFDLAEKFVKLKTDEPVIFNIMGHSIELDALNLWDEFEKMCQSLSEQDDIFYGTNREIYKI